MAMGQNPHRTASAHPNPTTKIGNLKWVVNSPTNQNGIPLVLTYSHITLRQGKESAAPLNFQVAFAI